MASRVKKINLSGNQLNSLILTLLDTPAPLTSAELRYRLLSRSIRLPEYEITQALRPLQSEGLVRFEKGRWRLTSKEDAVPTSTPDVSTIGVVHNILRPPSSIFNTQPQHMPKRLSTDKSADATDKNASYTGPWGHCNLATKPHILNMKNVLASELMESLMAADFTADQVEEYFTGFDHAIFTPTSSRQVLGVMNDLKKQLMFLMSDYYEEPLSFKEITKRLNETPYRIHGHEMCFPVEAFAERLNIVRVGVG